MNEEKMVRCFDENDTLLGEMTLREAQMAANGAKKDLVLRNQKISPPVVKVMNYKKELLKRLFKKLGKEMEDKDLKSKTIRLATTISYHDMENKKRQAK
jgi:translation initiation factor IF-3